MNIKMILTGAIVTSALSGCFVAETATVYPSGYTVSNSNCDYWNGAYYGSFYGTGCSPRVITPCVNCANRAVVVKRAYVVQNSCDGCDVIE
jgi:hypothetical protein